MCIHTYTYARRRGLVCFPERPQGGLLATLSAKMSPCQIVNLKDLPIELSGLALWGLPLFHGVLRPQRQDHDPRGRAQKFTKVLGRDTGRSLGPLRRARPSSEASDQEHAVLVFSLICYVLVIVTYLC